MATKRDIELGALVKHYREAAGLTQGAVAALLTRELGRSIAQNIVSELERGNRWSKQEPEIFGAYVRALNIPQDEMVQVTMGLSRPGKGPTPTTWRDVIEADPKLSAAAKAHLIAQYGLLVLASRPERPEDDSGSDSDEGPRRSNG